MANDFNSVDKHIESLTGDAREWVSIFVDHMRNIYPQLEEVISFQVPTYRLGSGKARNYIAFSAGKNHFSMHTTDFEYVNVLKTQLRNGGKGKGCVHVGFNNRDEKDILFHAIHDIYERSKNRNL